VERGEIDPYTAYEQLFYDRRLLKKLLSQLEKELA